MGFSHILSAMKNEFYMEMFLEQCQVDQCLHFYWVSAVLDWIISLERPLERAIVMEDPSPRS